MTVLVGILVSAFLALASSLGIAKVSQSSGLTNVALGLAAWFLWLVLVVTPAKMWKVKRERVIELEASMKPCLQVQDIVERDEGISGRVWALRVYNTGVHPAERCHGRLEGLEFETPEQDRTLARVLKADDLRWAGQGTGENYEVPGKSPADLDIIYCDGKAPYGRVSLVYRNPGQLDIPLPTTGTVLILVNITSAGRNPAYTLCRAELSLVTSLLAEGLADKPAVSIVYQGPQRPDTLKYQRQATSPSIPDKEGSQT